MVVWKNNVGRTDLDGVDGEGLNIDAVDSEKTVSPLCFGIAITGYSLDDRESVRVNREGEVGV